MQGIYIFGAQPQTVQINGGSIISGDLLGAIGSPDVLFSQDIACAYEYPNSAGGCDTDSLLGINFSFDNYLADLFANTGRTPMGVTSFNGSEFVDQFDVQISSVAAIPLPGALLMFASAVGGLFSIRTRLK